MAIPYPAGFKVNLLQKRINLYHENIRFPPYFFAGIRAAPRSLPPGTQEGPPRVPSAGGIIIHSSE
jgi:hypothetical protein